MNNNNILLFQKGNIAVGYWGNPICNTCNIIMYVCMYIVI